MHNLKFGLRALIKAPFVTLVGVLSLALGLGANSAIFSLFDQVLLSPLPVREPEDLVNLGAPGPKPGSVSCNNAGGCDQVFSYPMFRDLEREQTVFAGIAAHRAFSASFSYKGHTLSGVGMLVSGGYLPTLGLRPTLGRLLGSGDDRTIGESPVVVLSHDFWRTRFGEDPDVEGETLLVNGHSLAIVGVGPAGFHGTTLGFQPEVFVPISLRGLMAPGFDGFDDRRSYWVYVFARLKPDMTLEAAKATIDVSYRAIITELEAPLQEEMSDQAMERFKAKEVTFEPGARGQSSLLRRVRAPLLILFSVTGVVLLIACSNVANLLLARSASRTGEIALRLSIGASRRKLISQLLTEACLLAALGGLVGLLVARWTLVLIGSLLPAEAVGMIELDLDLKAIAFAAALSLGTGILFGLFPALHSTKLDLASTLKKQAGHSAGTRAAARARAVLVTAQIALSTTLLVSAGLFSRSLVNVNRIDLGIEIESLLTFAISPELNGYSPERAQALFERVEEELAALPGVRSVTAAVVPLLAGSTRSTAVSVEGFQAEADTDLNARFNKVGPGFFRTVGVPLVAGRGFTAADAAGAPKVAIVNEMFAKKFNLGREAVGKRMGTEGDLDLEIVGLVKNAGYSDVKDEVPPLFFTPYRQDEQLGAIFFYVRTALAPEQLLTAPRDVVARLDPHLPVEGLKTMSQQVHDRHFGDRAVTILAVAFATLATLLAAVGLYGLLAYTVAQRTREIGLRMALGADARSVGSMVLWQLGKMTFGGGLIGLAAAIAVGRLARSQLFEIESHDPGVLLGAALLLALVALGSGLVPALRATRVDPMVALRHE